MASCRLLSETFETELLTGDSQLTGSDTIVEVHTVVNRGLWQFVSEMAVLEDAHNIPTSKIGNANAGWAQEKLCHSLVSQRAVHLCILRPGEGQTLMIS